MIINDNNKNRLKEILKINNKRFVTIVNKILNFIFISYVKSTKSTILYLLFTHNSKTIYLANRYFASYAIFQELDTFKFTNCLTLEIHK